MPIGGIVSGIGSVIGSAMNARSQRKINEQNIRYAQEAYNRERQDAIADWHMQNAYNDPSQQMARLKNAGLNPNLVYGHGADAQMAAPVKPTKQQLPDLKAIDYGGIVSNAIGSMQAMANIKRTEAETDLIRSNNEAKQFDNEIRKKVGLDQYTQELELKMRSANTKSIAQITEFDADFRAMYGYDKTEMADKMILANNKINWNNSLLIKAKQAGVDKLVQDVENAKKLGILRDDQHTLNLIEQKIKDFAGNLTKLGLSPTSIQFLSVMTTVLRTIFNSR